MSDQLSLELDASLPRPPVRLRPMLPRPAEAPFDSVDHLFEPSWAGQRVLAFLEPAVEQDAEGRWRSADGGPSLRLVDAGGRDLADRLPELAGLALRVEARSAVLDGEIVVVDGDGRADPAALDARIAGEAGPDVAYLVFDLLYLEGAPLLGRPLTRRRDALRRVLRPGPEVVAVPAIVGEGRALHDAIRTQGLAGVLARRRDSPYLPGIRSRLWRFVPASATASATTEDEATVTGTAATGARPARPEPAPAGEGLWAPAEGRAEGPVGPAPVLAVFRRLPLPPDEDA